MYQKLGACLGILLWIMMILLKGSGPGHLELWRKTMLKGRGREEKS